MKEKTYYRMTKKRPLRGLKLFKQKYLTKQRFYALLARFRLVREVKQSLSVPYNKNDLIGKVTMLDENITTDRGTFNLSYRAEATLEKDAWYYENLYGDKRLYTVRDEQRYRLSVGIRSECLSFKVKIDPFTSCVVKRENPRIYTFTSPHLKHLWQKADTLTSTAKCHEVNFFGARLGTTVHSYGKTEEDIDEAIKELVHRARLEITTFIENRPEDINERLTGVKFDGEFHTKEGKQLLRNNICGKCGRPVFESSVEGYTAQCVFCDEDLYSIEVRKIDPVMYEDIYEFNKTALHKILTE